MRQDTWFALEERFEQSPRSKAEPVTMDEIAQAEQKVGIPLSADYKEFVVRYGGAIVGPYPIYGLRRAPRLGFREGSFVDVTKHFRQERWPGAEGLAIFSMDHDGNPIGLDPDGKVWIIDHDFGGLQILDQDFEGYLWKKCLNSVD